MTYILSLLLGSLFGILLVKGGVSTLENIRAMFNFESPLLYQVIASAIAVGMLSLLVLKKFQFKSIQGDKLEIRTKPWQKGFVYGGFIFGMGWYVTGACPGPIFAQLGSGHVMALASFGGALIGVYVYGLLRNRIPH